MLGSAASGAGLGSAGGIAGAGAGAVVGGIQGVTNEFQRALDGLSHVVRIAVFLTWWGPYILGMVNLVVLGLFPIVILWALFPQSQFRPLATYFLILFFTSSSPLWWALVDAAARLAQGAPPVVLPQIVNWAQVQVAYMMVTSMGVVLIPIVMGLLIFGAWRAIGGLWRGVA